MFRTSFTPTPNDVSMLLCRIPLPGLKVAPLYLRWPGCRLPMCDVASTALRANHFCAGRPTVLIKSIAGRQHCSAKNRNHGRCYQKRHQASLSWRSVARFAPCPWIWPFRDVKLIIGIWNILEHIFLPGSFPCISCSKKISRLKNEEAW